LGAFFISKDYDVWNHRFRRLLPKNFSSRIDQILLDLRNALFGFVKAQLTLISLTAAIVIVGLLILRVDFAITIGLITGLVDLLPYLGTGTVFVPWIVYAFFKGNYSLVIGLSILYGVVVIFRQIVEPKVVAENVGLDPLLTLVALFVGLQLFGFFGLIAGPVSLVVINALIKANVLADLWAYIKGKPS
jgi:sporulation integral membrane protein YtvI